MRRGVGVLVCVPFFVGCVGRGSTIKSADAARDRGEWAKALSDYESVLAWGSAEEWDKDRAESRRAEVWHELKKVERGKADEALGELERKEMPDVERVGALATFVKKAREANSPQATWDRVAALRARSAPGAWRHVEKLGADGHHLEAEELGLTLATLPGTDGDDAKRLAAVRTRATASYEALRKERPARSSTALVYGALADHFAGRPLRAPAASEVDWAVAYDLELAGPPECAEVLTALRAELPSQGGTRVRAKLSLSRCQHDEAKRTETRMGESGEDVQVGVERSRVEVTEEVCETTTSTDKNQRARVVDTGAGTSATIKWVETTEKKTTTCGPKTFYKDFEKPIFELQKKQVPYEHAFRTITTSLVGSVQAVVPEGGALEKPLNFGLSREDDAFERSIVRWDADFGKHLNHIEKRTFRPDDAKSIFAEHEAGVANVIRELGKTLARSKGELLLARSRMQPREDQVDLVLQAVMLGSKNAEAQLGSLAVRPELPTGTSQLALLGGKDPFAAESNPWPRPSGTEIVDTPPPPKRVKGFPGYKAGFRWDIVAGALSAGPLSSGTPAAGVPNRETGPMLGMHLELPLLGWLTERGHGFTVIDAAALDGALAYRASTDPPNDAQGHTIPVGYRIGAAYTAYLGARIGPVGVLGGARIEADMARTGEIAIDGGFSLPLCARLEYRYVEYFMPRVSACAFSLAGRERITGELTVPFATSETAVHLYGRFDRIVAGANIGTFGLGGYTDQEVGLMTFSLGVGTGL
jgi:hypothetical protein